MEPQGNLNRPKDPEKEEQSWRSPIYSNFKTSYRGTALKNSVVRYKDRYIDQKEESPDKNPCGWG